MKKIAYLILVLLVLCQFSNHKLSAAAPPIIWAFQVTPASVTPGGTVTISWIVIAADTVTIDNGVGNVGLAGTKSVTLNTPGTVTFTLTAKNGAGTSVAQNSVEVLIFLKLFGGSYEDEGYSVQQTSDGGAIVAGYWSQQSFGGEDIYLLKTDANGNVSWQKTYGGSGTDKGYCLQQTTDGGFIIGGESNVSNLIKTDSLGNKVWQKYFNWPAGTVYSVRQTSDGGYILATHNAHLIKTDALGNVLWDKRFCTSGSYDDCTGYSAIQTSDGGYAMTGSNWLAGPTNYDMFLVTTDANGNQKWYKRYGGSENNVGKCVRQTPDGGYIIAGFIEDSNYTGYNWLVKTDGAGNAVWDRQLGVSGGLGIYETNSVILAPDGGYVFVGNYASGGQAYDDIYIVKLDSLGNKLWEKIIDCGNYELGRSITATLDGGFMITGTSATGPTTGRDIILLKIQ